jgi:hypothetical protein
VLWPNELQRLLIKVVKEAVTRSVTFVSEMFGYLNRNAYKKQLGND